MDHMSVKQKIIVLTTCVFVLAIAVTGIVLN